MTRIIVIMIVAAFQIHSATHEEESLYNRIGTLRGQVFAMDKPRMERGPVGGHFFVMQRADCLRCLIGVLTDNSGNYQVHLGEGTYRIYSTDPHSGANMLHRRQTREVTILGDLPYEPLFDIELITPEG